MFQCTKQMMFCVLTDYFFLKVDKRNGCPNMIMGQYKFSVLINFSEVREGNFEIFFLCNTYCALQVAYHNEVQHFKMNNWPLNMCLSGRAIRLKPRLALQFSWVQVVASWGHSFMPLNSGQWCRQIRGHCKATPPLLILPNSGE